MITRWIVGMLLRKATKTVQEGVEGAYHCGEIMIGKIVDYASFESDVQFEKKRQKNFEKRELKNQAILTPIKARLAMHKAILAARKPMNQAETQIFMKLRDKILGFQSKCEDELTTLNESHFSLFQHKQKTLKMAEKNACDVLLTARTLQELILLTTQETQRLASLRCNSPDLQDLFLAIQTSLCNIDEKLNLN